MDTETQTEAGAVFALGMAAAPERWLEGVPYLVNPLTGKPESLEHLLLTPLRKKDWRNFVRTEDFIAYVNRFKEADSTLYVVGNTVKAELDHRGAGGALAAGDHGACIEYGFTTAMLRWIGENKKALGQAEFADLLEDRACDIVHPESAEMLEIAGELHVTTNRAVASVRRQGANHCLTFSDEQKVRGAKDSEIPARFELRLRPFVGSTAVIELCARLRVVMRSDKPAFIYELQDVQERTLEVLRVISSEIAEKTGLPAYI